MIWLSVSNRGTYLNPNAGLRPAWSVVHIKREEVFPLSSSLDIRNAGRVATFTLSIHLLPFPFGVQRSTYPSRNSRLIRFRFPLGIWLQTCECESVTLKLKRFVPLQAGEAISTEGHTHTMWKPATAPNANPGTKTPEAAKTTSTSSPATTPAATPTTTTTTMTEPTPVSAPRNAALNTNEQATIGKSLVIKGEVTGSESLYIDGRVEGSINLPGNRVTIGRNGVVAAHINAREIVVLGKVKGNVNASDRVDIRNEGSLGGDVTCQRISIEDGAWFKGGIDIRKAGQAGQKPNGEEKSATAPSNEAVAARA